MKLGDKIKYLREERGMVQQELADLLNVNRVTVTGYEIGRRTPDVYTLKKIAMLFNVTMDYLLEEEL